MTAFPIAMVDLRKGSVHPPLHFRRASVGLSPLNGGLAQVPWDTLRRIQTAGRRADGALVERRSANLLATSDDFRQEPWERINLDLVKVPSGWGGPIAGASPSMLYDNNTEGLHLIYQDCKPIVPQISYSGFFKAQGLTKLQLLVNDRGSNNIHAGFDLSSGQVLVVGQEGAGANSNACTEYYGEGWWRCILSGEVPQVGAHRAHTFLVDQDNVQYAGQGQSICCWGLQLEPGMTHTSFIPTSPGKGQIRESEDLILETAHNTPLRAIILEVEAVTKTEPAPIFYLQSASGRSELFVWQQGLFIFLCLSAPNGKDDIYRGKLPFGENFTRRIGLRLRSDGAEVWVAGEPILMCEAEAQTNYIKCQIGGGDGLSRWGGIISAVEAYADMPSESQMQAVTI